jgi:hypothetical protein
MPKITVDSEDLRIALNALKLEPIAQRLPWNGKQKVARAQGKLILERLLKGAAVLALCLSAAACDNPAAPEAKVCQSRADKAPTVDSVWIITDHGERFWTNCPERYDVSFVSDEAGK